MADNSNKMIDDELLDMACAMLCAEHDPRALAREIAKPEPSSDLADWMPDKIQSVWSRLPLTARLIAYISAKEREVFTPH